MQNRAFRRLKELFSADRRRNSRKRTGASKRLTNDRAEVNISAISETLEDRTLLAGDADFTILLDFDPTDRSWDTQTIGDRPDGSSRDTFFDSPDPSIMDFDTDGDVDSQDHRLFRGRVIRYMREFFKPWDNVVDIGVTRDGWKRLVDAQGILIDDDVFVHFVADTHSTRGGLLGQSTLAPIDHNDEFVSFTYAGNIANLMGNGRLIENTTPDDFAFNVAATAAHEIGHSLGLGHPKENGNRLRQDNPNKAYLPDNWDQYDSLLASGAKNRGSAFVDVVYSEVDQRSIDFFGNLSDADGPQNQFDELTASFDTGLFTGQDSEFNLTGKEFEHDEVDQEEDPTETAVPARDPLIPGNASATSFTSVTPAQVASALSTGFDAFRSDFFDDVALQLNLPGGAVPFVASAFASILDLDGELQNVVSGATFGSATTMLDLSSKLSGAGFVVDQILSDSDVAALANSAPADFVRAGRVYSLLDFAQNQSFNTTGLGTVDFLKELGFSGSLDLASEVFFQLTFGVDTGGFYVLPGKLVDARFSTSGMASASFGSTVAADGLANFFVNADVELTTANTDGRIRLSDLSSNFASHIDREFFGRASLGLDVDLLEFLGSPIEVDGNWVWDLSDSAGLQLNTAASGFHTDSLLDSLSEAIGTGVKKLAQNSRELVASTSLPLIGDAFADVATESFAYDNDLGTGFDYLEELGFTDISTIDLDDLVDAAINGTALSTDLFSARYQRNGQESVSFDLGGEIDLTSVKLQLNETPVTAAVNFNTDIRFGIDTIGGPFLREGGQLGLDVDFTAPTLGGTAAITGLVDINVTSSTHIDAEVTKTLTNGTGGVAEKLYLDSSIDALLADTGSLVASLDIDLKPFTVAAQFPLLNQIADTAGVRIMPRLAVEANADFTLSNISATPTVVLSVDNDAFRDSLAESLLTGVQQVQESASGLATAANEIPLIGNAVQAGLSTAIGDTLNFDPGSDSAVAYLEARGFTFESTSATALSFIEGRVASGELMRVRYQRDVTRSSFNTNLQDQHLTSGDLFDFRLSGAASITPQFEFDITFGLDTRGPFIVESASNQPALNIGLAANGTLTGRVEVGSLLGIDTTVNLSADVGAAIRLDDGDSTPGERLFLLDGSAAAPFSILSSMATSDDREKLVGLRGLLTADAGLRMSSPAAHFDLFPASLSAFEWNAKAVYDVLQDTATFDVARDAKFDAIVSLLNGSVKDDIYGEFLGFVDQYNPLPQILRDALTTQIPLTGDTLLGLAGAEAAAIVVNPNDFRDKSPEETEQSAEPDAIDVNLDFLEPSSIFALLSGGDADLISIAVDQDYTFSKDIPLGPKVTVASFFGILNVNVQGGLSLGAEIGVNLRAGFDTKGFFLDENPELVTFTGSIGGTLTATGELVVVPFAEVKAEVALPITIGAGIESPDSSGKIRANQIGSATKPLSLEVALDLGLTGRVGFLDLGIEVSTGRIGSQIVLYRADGTVEGVQEKLASFRQRMQNSGDRALELVCAGGILTGNVIVAAVGCGARYGEDILKAAADFDEWRLEKTEAILKGAQDVADKGGEYLSARRDSLVNGFNEGLTSIGDSVDNALEKIGVPKDFFGDGGFEPREVEDKNTFEINRNGRELQVIWSVAKATGRSWSDIGRGNSVAALVNVGIENGQLVVDGPNFTEMETYAVELTNCLPFLGCDEHPQEAPWTHVNQLRFQLSDFVGDTRKYDKISIIGSEFGDELYGSTTLTLPVEFHGLDGNDVVVAGMAASRLFGGDGDDELIGRLGNDYLSGGNGDDFLLGDQGDDTLIGGEGDDTIDALTADGSNLIPSGSFIFTYPQVPARPTEVNFIQGGGGNDTIIGGDGPDQIFGDEGRDQISGGGGSDQILGGAGNDQINGDSGNDQLDGGDGDDLLIGSGGDDSLRGGDGNDDLFGDFFDNTTSNVALSGSDLLSGGAGNDAISAGPGNDVVFGGAGGDLIQGGAGDDLIRGADSATADTPANGNDVIFGGEGDDTIEGGPSGPGRATHPNVGSLDTSILNGGEDDDTISGGDGTDLINGGDGDDFLRGGGGDDVIRGVTGSDTILGEAGDDLIYGSRSGSGETGSSISGGEGKDTIVGSEGVDTISGDEGDDGIAGLGGTDTITGNLGDDEIYGDSGDDQITGDDGNDRLFGGLGSDSIRGSSGNDFIDGEDDDDILFGDDGADEIHGGSGADEINGGDDDDQLFGGDDTDIVRGESGNDVIRGGDGPDTLFGGLGADMINGDQDDDLIDGGVGDDRLNGDHGADQIFGRDGVDIIHGNSGSDIIEGNQGADLIFGDSENDLVIWRFQDGADDIDGGTGSDLLDFTTSDIVDNLRFDHPDSPGANGENSLEGAEVELTLTGSAEVTVEFRHVEVADAKTGKGQDVMRVHDLSAAVSMVQLNLIGGTESDHTFIGNGDINLLPVPIEVISGHGFADRVEVVDDGNLNVVDYVIRPDQVTSINALDAPSTQPHRSFAGISYDSQTEFLDVLGSDERNTFETYPSLDTEYFINGNLPRSMEVCAQHGDFLKLITTETEGRHLIIDRPGDGAWVFSSDHQSVNFESIERFNHVDIIAVPEPAGDGSKTRVRVFDAETLDFKFEFLAYDAEYENGVSLAVGDVNEDGLPDIVTGPGRLHQPEVRVFDGSPQSGLTGTLISDLTIPSSATYGEDYLWGINVAVGDVNGDGCNDIITAPRRHSSTVRVFQNAVPSKGLVQFEEARSFEAFGDINNFIGGVNIAIGDIDGADDGNANGDIVASSGSGIPGRIRVFDVTLNLSEYLPSREISTPNPGSLHGHTVAVADIDGDADLEIISSGLSRGNSLVDIYDSGNSPIYSHQVYSDASQTAPVHVAISDFDYDMLSDDELYVYQMEDGRNSLAVQVIDPTTGSELADLNTVETSELSDLHRLDLELELYFRDDYYEDWAGLGEKWVSAEDGTWHYITPDGELYEWRGSGVGNSILVAALPKYVHRAPQLLHEAFDTYAAANADAGSLTPDFQSASGLDRRFNLRVASSEWHNWAGLGEKWLYGTGGWYYITPDGSLYQTRGQDPTNRTLVGKVDSVYHAHLGALAGASEAAQVDSTYKLSTANSLFENWGGWDERWLYGAEGWYFLTQDGRFYQWTGGDLEDSNYLSDLDSIFYDRPELLVDIF